MAITLQLFETIRPKKRPKHLVPLPKHENERNLRDSLFGSTFFINVRRMFHLEYASQRCCFLDPRDIFGIKLYEGDG